MTREQALAGWEQAPCPRAAHPEPNHFLPLMVMAGAATGKAAMLDFHDVMLSKAITGCRLG